MTSRARARRAELIVRSVEAANDDNARVLRAVDDLVACLITAAAGPAGYVVGYFGIGFLFGA